jgi:hypothetical protein
MMIPPKNIEPPKSSVDEVIAKKPDVIMKPPSDLIVDKKEEMILAPKEPLSKYPSKEDYYKKPASFDPKRYTRDDDRDYRAAKYHHMYKRTGNVSRSYSSSSNTSSMSSGGRRKYYHRYIPDAKKREAQYKRSSSSGDRSSSSSSPKHRHK